MVRLSSACVLAVVISTASAFVVPPSVGPFVASSSTELSLSRREALNSVVGIALGGILAGGFPEPSLAAANPALQTFKGGKKTKGSFIPGKGLREHESFDQLIASNPALETMKGRKRTKGSFIPGKGIREHESFNQLVASNPALETMKGRKKTKGSFIPGKGIREHESFDQLIASNPALETFKGRKMTKGSFIPGKGLRSREENLLS